MTWKGILPPSIAVHSLAAATETFTGTLGLETMGEVKESRLGYGLRWQVLGANGAPHVELIEAVAPESPIARHLARRGESVYQLRYAVADLEVHCRALEAAGARVVWPARSGGGDSKLAWVHPSSAHGVLIELKETGDR
jgi:methylmalonyl-CoA/ethylmalonyl-CoA epimerase